jgi:hypothetical protein
MVENKRAITDDEKSMAVINLQAMLDTDDIGMVLQLLEENNFDESAAAGAFYSKQTA